MILPEKVGVCERIKFITSKELQGRIHERMHAEGHRGHVGEGLQHEVAI